MTGITAVFIQQNCRLWIKMIPRPGYKATKGRSHKDLMYENFLFTGDRNNPGQTVLKRRESQGFFIKTLPSPVEFPAIADKL